MTLKTFQGVTPSGISQGKFKAGYLDLCATGRRGGFLTAQAGGPWVAGTAVRLVGGCRAGWLVPEVGTSPRCVPV